MKQTAFFGWASWILLATGIPSVALTAPSFQPEQGSIAETKAKPSDWDFTPDPALPNVLILGDSISIGYTLGVRKALAGKANVFRPMGGKQPANCGGTTAGVTQIGQWLGTQKWSVIHFNWGLHDLKHVQVPGTSKNSDNPADPPQATVEQYTQNLAQIVGKLKGTGARLIFATTTPVAPGTSKPAREPEAPPRYNQAALKIMQAEGIRVNDLFAFCEPQLEKLQLPKNVHFTPAGSLALAQEVARAISEVLPEKTTSSK
jgi:lysophospholipase L1-like esterase